MHLQQSIIFPSLSLSLSFIFFLIYNLNLLKIGVHICHAITFFPLIYIYISLVYKELRIEISNQCQVEKTSTRQSNKTLPFSTSSITKTTKINEDQKATSHDELYNHTTLPSRIDHFHVVFSAGAAILFGVIRVWVWHPSHKRLQWQLVVAVGDLVCVGAERSRWTRFAGERWLQLAA